MTIWVRTRRAPVILKNQVKRVTIYVQRMHDNNRVTDALARHDTLGLQRLGVRWWDRRRNQWRDDWPDWMWEE